MLMISMLMISMLMISMPMTSILMTSAQVRNVRVPAAAAWHWGCADESRSAFCSDSFLSCAPERKVS